METQDKMLDTIGNTVSTLKAQAGLMGREVLEQVGMLEDLESGVERSQTRLDRASKKMNEFVQKNKSTLTMFPAGNPAADILFVQTPNRHGQSSC
jgi:syntaxin 6